MTLHLKYKSNAEVPLEVEGIVPERVADLSIREIEKLQTYHGNNDTVLGEFFSVTGDPTTNSITWEGDLAGVHWIGAKMSRGSMRIDGNAGRHLGSEMTGGSIHVSGNAGDWVGGEMKGGAIQVQGNAGHLIGAAYRGSAHGMTGGSILIHGDAGNEIGHTMRRGSIAVGGKIGDLAGFNMLAGTLLFFGDCGIRHGGGMRRGTIAFFGKRPDLLPTFRFACRYQPTFLALILRQLRKSQFPCGDNLGELDLYHGDLIEGGRGEILLATE